jgi:hypothetical protein
MKVEFGEVKPLVEGVGINKEPILGSFSVTSPVLWYKCREQFAGFFDASLPAFFFSHPIGAAEHIAAFISKTEDVLSCANSFEQRTEFCRTNRPFALWVSPAPFWKECPIRRSLFTILLRCGFQYREAEDNYEQALYSEAYITETRLAVHRFLFGHTKFVNHEKRPVNSGWRDFFRNLSQDNVVHALALPENSMVERTMLGLGALWN